MSIEQVDIELDVSGRGHIKVGERKLDNVVSLYVPAEAGHMPTVEISCVAHPLKLQLEGEVTFVDPLDQLQKIREFHSAWGERDGEDLDLLALWEDLAQILGSTE